MSVDNTAGNAAEGQSLPDDFAAYTAARMQQETPEDPAPVVEDTPAEDAEPASETEPEAAPEQEDQEQPEEEEKPEQQPKKKGGWQRRIDQLTREKRELEAKLESLAKPAETTKAPADKSADADGEPQIGDFETYDAYTRALARFEARQLIDAQLKSIRDEQAKAQAEAAAKTEAEKWDAQQADARKRYADFDDVVSDPDLQISAQMAEVIRDSDKGADLAYWLGQHPERAAEIAKLTRPVAVARELGKIEAELERPAPVATKPKVSKAPEPITPVASKAKTSKAPEEMSFSEYARWRSNGGGKTRR